MSETTTTTTHSPFLQHHYAEMEQQVDAGKIGMWLFLATEVLLFGGLFVGFAIMSGRHHEAFRLAHEHLSRPLGALNTVVLLVSSFTMVMAVHSARHSRQRALVRYLAATLALAGAFLVVKYFEYSHKFHDGLLPGRFYTAGGPEPAGQAMFFSFYFMMTGLHGLHILGGMVVLTWLLVRSRRGHFSSAYYAPVDLGGLYWHLVDMIWIYLFPLLYLIG